MPEPAAWRYQKIQKPIFDIPAPHRIFIGRVLTSVGDEVIERGCVEVKNGKIVSVGSVDGLSKPEQSEAEVIDCTGKTIIPGLMQSHAHLAWDGIHDLANQSMDDAPEISAYKSAANM